MSCSGSRCSARCCFVASPTACAGIRGLGTLYYLAYATNKTEFVSAELIWSTCVFTILVSVVVHGLAVPVLVRRSERRGVMTAAAAT